MSRRRCNSPRTNLPPPGPSWFPLHTKRRRSSTPRGRRASADVPRRAGWCRSPVAQPWPRWRWSATRASSRTARLLRSIPRAHNRMRRSATPVRFRRPPLRPMPQTSVPPRPPTWRRSSRSNRAMSRSMSCASPSTQPRRRPRSKRSRRLPVSARKCCARRARRSRRTGSSKWWIQRAPRTFTASVGLRGRLVEPTRRSGLRAIRSPRPRRRNRRPRMRWLSRNLRRWRARGSGAGVEFHSTQRCGCESRSRRARAQERAPRARGAPGGRAAARVGRGSGHREHRPRASSCSADPLESEPEARDTFQPATAEPSASPEPERAAPSDGVVRLPRFPPNSARRSRASPRQR